MRDFLRFSSISFLLVMIFSNLSLAQDPGGVSGAELWLKANVGVTSSSGTVTGWTDQKGINSFTVSGNPSIGGTSINFNDAVSFDGNGDFFTGNTSITFRTLYGVIKRNTTDFASTVMSVKTDGQNVGYIMKGDQLATGNNNSIYFRSTGNLGTLNARLAIVEIVSGASQTNQKSFIDGLSYSTVLFGSNTGNMVTFSDAPYIGRSQSTTEPDYFNGQIGELIMFNDSHSDAQRNRIESYLAIKYGISLGSNTDAIAYTNSAGNTVWAANATYKYDIFGIGQDNGSGLTQSSSNSVNTGSGDGTGQSGKGNIVLSNPSSLGNMDFLIIGHDNAALNEQTTEVPLSGMKRIAREWKVQSMGTPGTVNLSFDILGLSLSGSTASHFRLLIDDDGDFSSGATVVSASSITGTKVEFTGVNIPDAHYLTFITFSPLPGGISGANLWLKANAGASNSGGNLTGWTDQAATNTFTVTGTPGYTGSGLNFYPVVTFDNSQAPDALPGSYLAGNTAITVQEAFAVYKSTNAASGALIGSALPSPDPNYGAQILGGLSGGDVYVSSGELSKYYHKSSPLVNVGVTSVVGVDLATGGSAVKFYLDDAGISAVVNGGAIYSSINLTPWIGGTNNGYIATGWKHFRGEVAEIITYQTSLSETDRHKVISYLSIKYGIRILPAILNYIASDGTVLFSNALENAHRTDVFGIGRDDASGLNQTQSNSVNSGSGDGTGQSGKGNIVLSNPSSLDNFDFLLMGHNTKSLSFREEGAELHGDFSSYRRSDRTWLADRTGDVGTVTLTFDLTGISGITVGGAATDYAILMDADTNFTSGATKVDASSLSGNSITFTGLTIADNQYFTFIGKTSALPVELTSFTGTYASGKVVLNWETATEISNYGFEVERSNVSGQWLKIGFVPGSGNSNSPKTYSYEDKSFISGKLQYRLKQVDTDGAYEYSPVVEVNADIPATYELRGNYPNPFNPSTRIAFGIPERGAVKLTVFNALGETVAELVNGILEAGRHTAEFNAAGLPSGIYFYRLEAGKFVQTNKMLLLK